MDRTNYRRTLNTYLEKVEENGWCYRSRGCFPRGLSAKMFREEALARGYIVVEFADVIAVVAASSIKVITSLGNTALTFPPQSVLKQHSQDAT